MMTCLCRHNDFWSWTANSIATTLATAWLEQRLYTLPDPAISALHNPGRQESILHLENTLSREHSHSHRLVKIQQP